MLENDITKLGLSDKEAKVYLASLELGPATAQIISQKSNVNRATTYVVIESLMEMGLISTYDEGKKTFFIAESPERLLEYLKDQERNVNDKINLLKEKMPELQSIRNGSDDRPIVKYFEGIEGLRAVQDDFIDSLGEGEIIYTFLPYDKFYGSHLKEKVAHSQDKRMAKKITMNIIYTSKNGRQEEYEKNSKELMKNCIFMPYEKFPIDGGMNIYGNKIFLIDYLGKTGGIVIENRTLANLLRVQFMSLWNFLHK